MQTNGVLATATDMYKQNFTLGNQGTMQQTTQLLQQNKANPGQATIPGAPAPPVTATGQQLIANGMADASGKGGKLNRMA